MGRASAAELAESAANGVGPESVLKKRKRQEKYQEKQQAERALAHTKGTASRQGEKDADWALAVLIKEDHAAHVKPKRGR